MKFWKLASVVAAMVLTTSVNAALIDNGNYTTDNSNNLEWLDLTFTDGLAYSSALSAASSVEGGGWKYATKQQVNLMWSQVFPADWTPLNDGRLYSKDYREEVDHFSSLFGLTYEYPTNTQSFGWFLDDNGNLKMAGVLNVRGSLENSDDRMFGADHTLDYNDRLETGDSRFGTYLVRTSVVPVPAALWLFSSGLIGLVGFARRKKA